MKIKCVCRGFVCTDFATNTLKVLFRLSTVNLAGRLGFPFGEADMVQFFRARYVLIVYNNMVHEIFFYIGNQNHVDSQ